MMKRRNIPWLAAVLLMVASGSGYASDTEFEAGSRAYKGGNYTEALAHFDASLAAGNTKPTLIYNRAVTLYKLQRLDDAKVAFTRLLQDQQWTDLARYNLGLIALAQGDKSSARIAFTHVSQATTNARLQQLGNQQLAALAAGTAVASPAIAKKGTVLLSLGAAVDDNASGLADELVRSSSAAEDTYYTGLAYGQYYVSGKRTDGIKLYGLTQTRRYQTFGSFDSQVTGVGSALEWIKGNWAFEVGGRVLNIHVDGNLLANQYSLLSKATTGVRGGKLELSYQSSRFNAGKRYGYIDGSQHQAKAALQYTLGSVYLSPALSWETNDRDNRASANNFYSYSPTVRSASALIHWDVNKRWRLYSELTYSDTRYSGKNRLTDLDGKEKHQQRKNTSTQALLGTRYQLSPRVSLKGEYSRTNNDDVFALYTQDKNLLSLKLDYAW